MTLRLRDDVRLTAVEVDGRAVEVSRREFPVDPGERRILVRGACGGTVDAILSAQRGGRLSVDATGLCVPETPKRPQTTPSDLHMPEAERAPPKLATDDPASPFPLAPTLLGAAGILTAGLGSYLYFDGRADHTAAISQCGKTCGSTEWNLQFEEASSRMLTGDILLGAGGALIVSSIVWWLIQDDGTQNETEATPTVGISPVEGGAYGSVLGTF